MTLRDFIDDIEDDEFIYLILGEYGFASANSFRKYAVNKSSKLLDCKVQSVGSGNIDGHIVIIVRIECEDLNDCKNFFK
jgi:hypothetical protein